MVAADCSAARSILVFKHDEDKIIHLDTTTVAALAGESGDRSQLGDYLKRNITLNKLRTGISQSCDSIANFIRRQVNCLIFMLNVTPGLFHDCIADGSISEEITVPSKYANWGCR
jgi:20S proteasome alpha/beta subunit